MRMAGPTRQENGFGKVGRNEEVEHRTEADKT